MFYLNHIFNVFFDLALFLITLIVIFSGSQLKYVHSLKLMFIAIRNIKWCVNMNVRYQ